MDHCSKENNVENGPYRATKLWNNVVYQFKNNLPVGRHRRNMRVFENCFVASDAVDWLHNYLISNEDFGENVSRYQAVQLLQKFEKAKIFEDVRSVKRREMFQANGRLYRFMPLSPKKRTPLKETVNTDSSCKSSPTTPRKPREALNFNKPSSVEKPELPQCQLVKRSLSKEQTEKVWKTVALGRLQKLLNKISIHDVVDFHDIQPQFIIHNSTYVSRNGIVTNIQKDEHLPQWIISAMRCLAHWPNAVQECLPSYPGFEKDVFHVVRDYFQNLDEPLLTFELYDIFYNVFVHCDQPAPWRSTPRHPMGMSNDSFLSMENLMTSLASPRPLSNLNLSCIMNNDGHSPSHINQSFTSLQSFNKSEPNIHETMYITARDESYYDNFAFDTTDRKSPAVLRRYYSSSNLNDAENYLRNGQDNIFSRTSATSPPQYRPPPPYQKLRRQSSQIDNSRDQSCISNNHHRSSSTSERMVHLLQVCCLFLPPPNRRKLHLLLRLMYKMSHNEELCLGTGTSVRSCVLETFYRCILLCIDKSYYEDQVGLQLAAFMMDHHEQIMMVPDRLKQSVDKRINDMQRIQIRYNAFTPSPVAFSQRVSVHEYEQQKLTNSEEALVDLLDTILKNEKMTEKEKRRRLKQFQKVYPDIYRKRFPGEGEEEGRRKHLLHGMTGALTKLKAMRF